MLKFVAKVSALAILAIGLIAQPANAWPDYTVSTSFQNVGQDVGWVVPVGKTVTSDAVFVYPEQPQDSSPRRLRSYTVSPTGEIGGPYTIISNSNSANYVVRDTSVWIDSNKQFNVIFWSWRSTDAGLESVLYHTISPDGVTWSAPAVLETFVASGSACLEWCGLRFATVAISPTGTAALTYVMTEGSGVNKLYLRTKPAGKDWTSKDLLNQSTDIQESVILKSLGKGWLATWGAWGSANKLYSAFSTGDKISTWTAPQLREPNSPCASPKNILQISPTKLGLIYITGCEDGSVTTVYKYQSFDPATKRFGSPVTLDSVPNRGWSNTPVTDYRAGQSAFGYTVGSYQSSDIGYAKYILFRNGVPTVQYVNQNAATEGGTQVISGMHMDLLGHLTVVWSSLQGQTIALTISQIYRGTRADINAPISQVTSGEYGVIFSPDNDVYVSHYNNSKLNTIERIRSDAPDIDGFVSVTGGAKANSTLKAKLPLVSPSQLLQQWTNSYQWYTCQYQVPEASALEPVACTQILGATSSTYKAKATDKGRYLVLRLTVKSDNTSQVQYSASTTVVK